MKKAKRILPLLLATAMSLTLFGCGGNTDKPAANSDEPAANSASADPGQVYEIIYAGTVAETNPITVAFRWMAEELETRTDGRMKMTLYPNNTLGDTRANIESMQNNSVQIGEGSSAPLAIFTDAFMPMSLPFFFATPENAYDFAGSDFMAGLADQAAEEIGIRPVGWMLNGARCLTNSKNAVVTPADMKGLKVRVMENDIYIKTFEALGASPTAMSFAEVFTALQQGTVDGQDNGMVTIVDQSFQEVQSYLYETNHIIATLEIIANKATMDSLTEEQQTIVRDAAKAAAVQAWDDYIASIDEDRATIEEAGVTVTQLTDEEREKMIAAIQPTIDELLEQNADWAPDLIAKIDAVQ